MKTTMEQMPEFCLRPYDRLKLRTQTPRAMAVAEIEGHQFHLRCEQRIVFFREPNSPYSDYIFAIMPRIEHRDAFNPEAVKAFFELHFRENHIARFHLHYFKGCFEREFPLFFAADGSGVCREYYNEDDLPFSWQASEKWAYNCLLSLVVEDIEEVAEKIVYWQIVAPLNEMEFGPVKSDASKIEFLCGSRDELTRLARLVCCSHPQLFLEDGLLTLSFFSENQYTKAHLESIFAEDFHGAKNFHSFVLDENDRLQLTTYNGGSGRRVKGMPLSEAMIELFELILDYNTPTGIHWEYHDCCSGRASNSPWPNDIEVVVEKPSASEIQQAKEELRSWLQGKVTEREINHLLSTSA